MILLEHKQLAWQTACAEANCQVICWARGNVMSHAKTKGAHGVGKEAKHGGKEAIVKGKEAKHQGIKAIVKGKPRQWRGLPATPH